MQKTMHFFLIRFQRDLLGRGDGGGEGEGDEGGGGRSTNVKEGDYKIQTKLNYVIKRLKESKLLQYTPENVRV